MEARYAPTRAEVTAAERWLRSEGLTVGSVPKDRLFVSASGSAAKVEHAFGVSLGMYKVAGHKLRLAKGNLVHSEVDGRARSRGWWGSARPWSPRR